MEEYVICRIRKNKRVVTEQNKRKGYEQNDEYHPQKLLKYSASPEAEEHQTGEETYQKEMLSMQITNIIDSENLASALSNIESTLNESLDILCAQFEADNTDDNNSYWKKVYNSLSI